MFCLMVKPTKSTNLHAFLAGLATILSNLPKILGTLGAARMRVRAKAVSRLHLAFPVFFIQSVYMRRVLH